MGLKVLWEKEELERASEDDQEKSAPNLELYSQN
jgi:hypothetical protein